MMQRLASGFGRQDISFLKIASVRCASVEEVRTRCVAEEREEPHPRDLGRQHPLHQHLLRSYRRS
jgi:hypothetical protein